MKSEGQLRHLARHQWLGILGAIGGASGRVGGYQNRKIRVTLNPRRHSFASNRLSVPTKY